MVEEIRAKGPKPAYYALGLVTLVYLFDIYRVAVGQHVNWYSWTIGAAVACLMFSLMVSNRTQKAVLSVMSVGFAIASIYGVYRSP